jgi:hypothetical protein
VNSEKVVSRLALYDYGGTPVSSWVEARAEEQGFAVFLGADIDEEYEEGIRIATTTKNYSWRLFAGFILEMKEGLNELEAKDMIIIEKSPETEKGIQSEILKLAWCTLEGGSIAHWLVAQDDLSIELMELFFGNTLDESTLSLLQDIADLANDTFAALYKKHLPAEKLYEELGKHESLHLEILERERMEIIDKYSTDIEKIASHFDDTERTRGGGITAPTKRRQIRRWLHNYVVEHGKLPSGRIMVEFPFFGGTKSLGEIDFDKL